MRHRLYSKFKHFVHHTPYLNALYREINHLRWKRMYQKDPKIAANTAFKHVFKRDIDWSNPQNLIEKIAWLQFNSDTSLWTRCADKYAVRSYIEEQGLDKYLVKLYGHWSDANDINFDQLPNQFVLKTNNACETVIIVKDKSKLNIPETRKKLNKWLKKPFGYSSAQTHYLKIDPCIIAEEFLVQSKEDSAISPNSLIDYKMWCINGKFEFVLITYDRAYSDVNRLILDENWNIIPNALPHNSQHTYNEGIPNKPACWDEMIALAEKIAAPFPQLRVDLYVINNAPIFGEMTFTTGFGSWTNEFYELIGKKIDLNYPKFNN